MCVLYLSENGIAEHAHRVGGLLGCGDYLVVLVEGMVTALPYLAHITALRLGEHEVEAVAREHRLVTLRTTQVAQAAAQFGALVIAVQESRVRLDEFAVVLYGTA